MLLEVNSQKTKSISYDLISWIHRNIGRGSDALEYLNRVDKRDVVADIQKEWFDSDLENLEDNWEEIKKTAIQIIKNEESMNRPKLSILESKSAKDKLCKMLRVRKNGNKWVVGRSDEFDTREDAIEDALSVFLSKVDEVDDDLAEEMVDDISDMADVSLSDEETNQVIEVIKDSG